MPGDSSRARETRCGAVGLGGNVGSLVSESLEARPMDELFPAVLDRHRAH